MVHAERISIKRHHVSEIPKNHIDKEPVNEGMTKIIIPQVGKEENNDNQHSELHVIKSKKITANSELLREQKSRSKGKRVRFSTVEVREYPMILGDNPAVRCGPSITIDWRPFSRNFFHVETHVRMTPYPRRKPTEMAMPFFHREFLMKASGYTHKEILECTKQANIIKTQRAKTLRKLQMAQVEEMGESVKKSVKMKVFKMFTNKKKECGT